MNSTQSFDPPRTPLDLAETAEPMASRGARTIGPGSQNLIREDDGSEQTNPHIDPEFPDDPP